MASVVKDEQRDSMDCVICMEPYTDPRLLPCLHTYCLKCIEGWSLDRQPSDEMQCPLCKRVFSIPETGVTGLPKNLIIERMLRIKQQQQQPTVDHVTENVNMSPSSGQCEKHMTESLKLYCLDCNVAICTICLADDAHNGHKFMNASTVVDQYRDQLIADIGHLVEGTSACRDILQRAADKKEELSRQFAKTENEIIEATEQLKQTIDKHKDKLLDELSASKQRRLEEIEDICNEIQSRQAMIQNYKQYAAELTCDNTLGDIAQLARFLHDQTRQLLNFDAILNSDTSAKQQQPTDIVFTPADMIGDCTDDDNVVGKLGEDPKPMTSSLVHVFPRGNPVGGVTSLGSQLFVVRKKSKEQVEVYDVTSFKLKRYLRVPGLGSTPYAMASCSANNCVYIADHYVVNDDVIYRVEPSDAGDKISKWPGIRAVEGLCVNAKHNVLVTCFRSINEYSTHGVLIRQIDSGSVHLCHAIQLTSNRFAISSRIKNSVYIMSSDGRIIHSHLPRRLLGFPANQPCHMAIDNNGWILVADILANQITMLNQSLSVVRELTVSVDGGLKEPWTLCFDKTRSRLYVGEWDGGRVLVFDCKS